ncbi:spore coat protein CotJB [Clostridium sp.]|uniref:spore coat protein CotJB n=1 Tax=Clostridium sp. TaxID=1506 RepID=UPI001A5618BF|nr:spore coat protein CotJB [Clostridium sp.]MBK5241064.1 spore coat protein CotJB [Clostridium sp.]
MKKEMNGLEMEMLKQISATRFMMVDLALFLNTHPMERETIVEYNHYVMQWRELKENYEKKFGMLTQLDSLSPYPWQWKEEPWPWENEANFMFEKEEV